MSRASSRGPEHRSEHIPPQKDYVDISDMSLSEIADRYASPTAPDHAIDPSAKSDQLEKAARENLLLLDSLYTTTNHYIPLEFFKRLQQSVLLAPNKATQYADGYERVYGTEQALRAHLQNIRVVISLPNMDTPTRSLGYTRMPVWIIGAEMTESDSDSKQYLAVALENHLPSYAQNYTERSADSAYGRHHASREGFLHRARTKMQDMRNSDTSRGLQTVVAGVINQNQYGIVQFAGPTDLNELKVTAEDIRSLKRGKRDTYDIRPGRLAALADMNSLTVTYDARPQKLDDFAMIRFNVMGHLGNMAESYGIEAELDAVARHSQEARAQADELVARDLSKLGLPYSENPTHFSIPEGWDSTR